MHNLHYEQFADGTVKCIEDEIPFDLPNNWAWERLGNVSNIARGGSPRPIGDYLTTDPNGLNWIKIGDTEKGGKYIYSTKEKIIRDGLSKTRMVFAGDFLLTNSMSFGRPYILKVDGCIHDGWLVIGDIKNIFNQDYLYYALSSKFIFDSLSSVAAGSTVSNLKSDTVKSLLFPIPPLSEQKIIAEKSEKILKLINYIEQKYEEFDSDIQSLKHTILDLAIQGKLVPQDPNDEPASVLLRRIRAEKEELIKAGKIKRNKSDSVIFKGDDNSYYRSLGDKTEQCENIPKDFPATWEWCNLGLLFNHNTGKALNSSNTSGVLLEYITTSNVYWNRFELDNLKSMYFSESEIDKCSVKKGDLLVCEGGDVGRSAIWNYDKTICIQNHLHRLRPYDKINTKFYYYVLYFLKTNNLINGNGIGLQGLSSKALHSIEVPLPPLTEQKRIVEAIENTFESIDKIAELIA